LNKVSERARRGSKPLKRKVESKSVRRTVVVFTEGISTEPQYIESLKRLPHVAETTALTIEIDLSDHGRVPVTLVNDAIRRSRDREVDECWCMFDVEWPRNHPNLAAAVDRARTCNIGLAISNPCFELWLILHFGLEGRFLNSDEAERESIKRDGRSTGKNIDGATYMPMRLTAVKNAKILEKKHRAAGSDFPNDNPSSSVYKFLEAIGADRTAKP
jgi:hypothetical protein